MTRPDPRHEKAGQFSIRLSREADALIESEARRLQRSKSWLVESLAEEALAMRRFGGIAFRGEDAERRAWVLGSGLDVWEIVDMLRAYGSDSDSLLADNELSPHHLELALAYYRAHPGEIDDAIDVNSRPAEDWSRLYPFIGVARAAG